MQNSQLEMDNVSQAMRAMTDAAAQYRTGFTLASR
jgi:hypothetical protein